MIGILWLASYPKSGNTWLRAFLSRLLSSSEDININHLKTDGIASLRFVFDYITGVKASDLTEDEIESLRPKIYCYMAAQTQRSFHIKIHDAYTFTKDGQPLIPASASTGAVYIVRNPLDTAVSLAYHLGCDFDAAIEHMADPSFCFGNNPRHLHHKLREKLLTWSAHVESWTDKPAFPVKIVRYEDMHSEPLQTFTSIAKFAGLSEDPDAIKQAIADVDFRTLKQQEKNHGFCEKPAAMNAFFREGKVGDWKNKLTPVQVSRLLQAHGAVMKKLGYMDQSGKIII